MQITSQLPDQTPMGSCFFFFCSIEHKSSIFIAIIWYNNLKKKTCSVWQVSKKRLRSYTNRPSTTLAALNVEIFTGYLLDRSSGSLNSQTRVTPDTILQYLVSLPSLPEQHKIADCITLLDDVISKAKNELDAWQEPKKDLLQQMFV